VRVAAAPARAKRQKAKRSQPRVSKAEQARAQAEALFKRKANENVVSFPAA
jgi:hypothetical protein